MNGKYPLLVQAFPTMKITVKKGIDNDTQQAEAIQQKNKRGAVSPRYSVLITKNKTRKPHVEKNRA